MKKFISGVLAILICMSMVSCGSDSEASDNSENEISVVTESEIAVPEYNTLGLSVDDLVDKINTSGDVGKTFSSDCTTEELSDGKGSFKTNDQVCGCYLSGTYEISSNNIIDIKISYPYNDDHDETVNNMAACTFEAMIMQYIFDIETKTAMGVWMEASQVSDEYDYGDYNISVGYDSNESAAVTIIKPKNELK